MANITTRNLTSTTVTSSNLNKGSSLTHNELDSNFLNLNNEKIDVLNPDIQGNLKIDGTSTSTVGSLVFNEASDNGVHNISIKSPTALAANVAFTLPDNDGNANEVLITDGSGNLSWSATFAGDITEVVAGTHLSGGGASGSVTLNVDTSAISINDLSDVNTTGVANGKILKYDSTTSKFIVADDTDTGITDVVSDTTPQLGGNLDVNGNNIVAVSNGSINIDAKTGGTGKVNIKGDHSYSSAPEYLPQPGVVVDDQGMKVSGSGYTDILVAHRSTTGFQNYSFEVGHEYGSSSYAAGGSAGSFGFAAYSNSQGLFYPGTVSGVIGDGGDVNDSSANVTNNGIQIRTNNTGGRDFGSADKVAAEFREATTKFMDNHLVLSESSDHITVATTNNGDLKFEANEIVNKVKDAGGTLQTAGEFRDYAYTENTTNADDTSATTKYDTILDIDRGIRIGSTTNEFSSTGAAPNNNNAAYNLSGIIVGNTGNTWPAIDIISNGQGVDGSNPLRNRLGDSAAGGAFTNFPNAQFNFKASNGTAASPSALGSGKRMGQINFYGHDGTGYGGDSDAAPSVTITTSANETFSGDTRGGKIIFDVLPSGQSGGTGTTSNDRIVGLSLTGSELVVNPGKSVSGVDTRFDCDFKVRGSTTDDIFVVDAGTEKTQVKNLSLTGDMDVNGQKLVTASNGNLIIEPNGTGQIRAKTNIIEQHNANGLVIHNGNQGTHNGANFGAPEGDSTGSSMLFNTGIQVEGNGQYEYPALVLKNNSITGYNNLWAAKARPTGGTDYNDDTYLQDDDIIFRFFGAGYQGDDGAGNGVFSYGSATVDLYATEDHSASQNGGGFRVKTLNTGTAAASNAETEKFRIEDDVRVNPAGLNVDFRVHGENTDNVMRLDASKDKLQMNGVFRLHQASSDPSSNLENGDMYYNTSTHKFRGYANGAWVDLH